MAESLYDVLGVKSDATPKEITRAYRRLARKHHPDANPGDTDATGRFRAVQDAYDVLSDESRRAAYDRDGTTTAPPPNGGAAEILSVVGNALLDILHDCSKGWASVGEIDVVGKLRERVEGFVSQTKESRGNLTRGEKVLASAVDRFQVDDGEPNLLRDVVADKLRACRASLAQCDAELEKLKMVQKYLKKCRYDYKTGKLSTSPITETGVTMLGWHT